MAKTKGGYKLISLERNDLATEREDTLIVKGLHESIEASYTKALLVTGIVIGGVEKNDVWVKELKVVDGSFEFECYGYKITITADDEVTIKIPEGNLITLVPVNVKVNVDAFGETGLDKLSVQAYYEGYLPFAFMINDIWYTGFYDDNIENLITFVTSGDVENLTPVQKIKYVKI